MKILCVLYDDPSTGMPDSYALNSLPKIDKYPDGMTLPSPKNIDFNPGELLGCVSGELGLRKFLEEQGHTLVVTSDKDSEGCQADKELVDSDIVISQPFWPYYLTRKRIESAPNLKMAITAGIGSDHVDLQAAMDNKIDDKTEQIACVLGLPAHAQRGYLDQSDGSLRKAVTEKRKCIANRRTRKGHDSHVNGNDLGVP